MMKHIFPTYAQYPMEIVSGHDWHLVDNQQKSYLDFTSGIGVCSFGYSNDKIEHSVLNQLGKIWHTSNLYPSQLQDDVANALCPEGMLAFFCNSGTEANEAAFKLARKATGKGKVLAFNNGFHGRTYGSMSLTGNPDIQAGFKPLVPEVQFADYNDPDALSAITDDLAAVILEVIQGEGGVVDGNGDWLKQVAAKCHEQGVLLIIDEVQTGIGRTGKNLPFRTLIWIRILSHVPKPLVTASRLGQCWVKSHWHRHLAPALTEQLLVAIKSPYHQPKLSLSS